MYVICRGRGKRKIRKGKASSFIYIQHYYTPADIPCRFKANCDDVEHGKYLKKKICLMMLNGAMNKKKR